MQLYGYYIETVARNPVFAPQNWEYVKKFYHTCYKKIEHIITEEMLGMAYSMVMQGKFAGSAMMGIVPCMGVQEFMNKLHEETYDPKQIYSVWKELPADLIKNNETCGVCPVGYTLEPEEVSAGS